MEYPVRSAIDDNVSFMRQRFAQNYLKLRKPPHYLRKYLSNIHKIGTRKWLKTRFFRLFLLKRLRSDARRSILITQKA